LRDVFIFSEVEFGFGLSEFGVLTGNASIDGVSVDMYSKYPEWRIKSIGERTSLDIERYSRSLWYKSVGDTAAGSVAALGINESGKPATVGFSFPSAYVGYYFAPVLTLSSSTYVISSGNTYM
jgi:hypothetical protein